MVSLSVKYDVYDNTGLWFWSSVFVCVNKRELKLFFLLFSCQIIFFTNRTRVDTFSVHFVSSTSSECQHYVGIWWCK